MGKGTLSAAAEMNITAVESTSTRPGKTVKESLKKTEMTGKPHERVEPNCPKAE